MNWGEGRALLDNVTATVCNTLLYSGLGLTGVPVFNVNNNCSSGSSALMMAALFIQAGCDCTMAVGKDLTLVINKVGKGLSC